MGSLRAGTIVVAVVLLWTACVSSEGTRSSANVQQYDLPFDLVRESMLEALNKSGFRIDYSGFDGVHIYSARGINAANSQRINVDGPRNRSYRSSITVKVERIDTDIVEVTMRNPARGVNYGGSSTSRLHDQFFRELNKILDQE